MSDDTDTRADWIQEVSATLLTSPYAHTIADDTAKSAVHNKRQGSLAVRLDVTDEQLHRGTIEIKTIYDNGAVIGISSSYETVTWFGTYQECLSEVVSELLDRDGIVVRTDKCGVVNELGLKDTE